jgi:hypothetical protein
MQNKFDMKYLFIFIIIIILISFISFFIYKILNNKDKKNNSGGGSGGGGGGSPTEKKSQLEFCRGGANGQANSLMGYNIKCKTPLDKDDVSVCVNYVNKNYCNFTGEDKTVLNCTDENLINNFYFKSNNCDGNDPIKPSDKKISNEQFCNTLANSVSFIMNGINTPICNNADSGYDISGNCLSNIKDSNYNCNLDNNPNPSELVCKNNNDSEIYTYFTSPNCD